MIINRWESKSSWCGQISESWNGKGRELKTKGKEKKKAKKGRERGGKEEKGRYDSAEKIGKWWENSKNEEEKGRKVREGSLDILT